MCLIHVAKSHISLLTLRPSISFKERLLALDLTDEATEPANKEVLQNSHDQFMHLKDFDMKIFVCFYRQRSWPRGKSL